MAGWLDASYKTPVAYCEEGSALSSESNVVDEDENLVDSFVPTMAPPGLEKTDVAAFVRQRLGPIVDADESCWRVALLLCDENPDVRSETLKAIAKKGPSGGLHAREVAFHLRSRWTGRGDGHLRCMAAKALCEMGETAATHADCLKDMLGSDDITEHAHALTALAALGVAGSEDKLRFMRKVAGKRAAGAVHLCAVVHFLSDSSARVREEAARTFARIGEAGGAYAGAVAQLLNDEQLDVRRVAAPALAMMGEGGAAHASAVAQLLGDEDDGMCGEAAWSLARMGAAGAAHAGAIAQLLGRENAYACASAIEALAGMGATGAAYAGEIAQRLNDQNNVVRHWAVKALTGMSKLDATRAGEIAALLGDGQPYMVSDEAQQLAALLGAVQLQ